MTLVKVFVNIVWGGVTLVLCAAIASAGWAALDSASKRPKIISCACALAFGVASFAGLVALNQKS